MNTCHNPTSSPLAPLASPAPAQRRLLAWPGLGRLIQLASPAAVDLSHFLFTDRPAQDSSPRTTLTHYR